MKEIFGNNAFKTTAIKECKTLNKIIIANTEKPEDDEIVEMCLQFDIFLEGSR